MASELAEETQALLVKRFSAATEGNYFGVLGLEDSASTQQVQDAYFKLAKLIHPDKITILKLNVDENPQLAMEYQITSIPAMKVFNKGQVEKTIIGAKPKFALEQDLAPYIG